MLLAPDSTVANRKKVGANSVSKPKGRTVMRKQPKPKKKKTAAQGAVRKIFSLQALDWHYVIGGFNRSLYNTMARTWQYACPSGLFRNVSGYNWYSAAMITNFVYGLGYSAVQSPVYPSLFFNVAAGGIHYSISTGLMTGTWGDINTMVTGTTGIFLITPPGNPRQYNGQPKWTFVGTQFWAGPPTYILQPFSLLDPWHITREPGTPLTLLRCNWQVGIVRWRQDPVVTYIP